MVFASGTSFSSPTVAGAAAVLRAAAAMRHQNPTPTATQIRNALQRSANPNVVGDDSTRIDQGNGVIDVAAADARLASGGVSSQVPDLPFEVVAPGVARTATRAARRFGGDDEVAALSCFGIAFLRSIHW